MLDAMKLLWLGLVCSFAACKKAPPPPAPPVEVTPPPPAAEPAEEPPTTGGFHPIVQPPDLAAPPPASTINGNKNGPKQQDFEEVESAAQRKIQSCFTGKSWTSDAGSLHVSVRFTVGNDGVVKDAQIDAPVGAESLACIRAAVDGMTFPKFEGAPVHATIDSSFTKS